jgi:hypothetical protein
MKYVSLWAALGAVSWLGCGDQTIAAVTQLNLDRPVDIAFACYGAMRQTSGHAPPGVASDPVIATAQPVAACASLSPPTGAGTPVAGQEPLGGVTLTPDWYAFILQSASGTVALAKWPTKPADTIAAGVSDTGGDFEVLDGDPLTPGKNPISIGEDPVAIATDKAGCFEITANAGTCDLSELDINSALDDIPPVPGKAATPVRINRVPVTNANGGLILARPAAMVAEPGSTDVGFACPATATGRVFIAYPSCHLVAGVDTQTGKIVSGVAFDATGKATVLGGAALAGVSCPAECSASGTAAAATTPGPEPVALDLRLDARVDAIKPAVTSRLVIGSRNSVAPADRLAAPLTVVDLDPATAEFAPAPPLQISLEDPAAVSGKPSRLGVSAVALSPQIGMGGQFGEGDKDPSDANSPGGQGQYVYAVASDGTVRVADVLDLKHECDTQIDGRFVRKITDVRTLQCFTPGTAGLPRRSDARGPGIQVPGDSVPVSVTIFKGLSTPPANATTTTDESDVLPPGPTTLVGYFAVVTTSGGPAYVINVDDDYAPDLFSPNAPQGTSPVLVAAHQLRDSFSNRNVDSETADGMRLCAATDPPASVGGAAAGGPRLSSPPAAVPPTGTIKLGSTLPLPTIHEVECTPVPASSGDPVAVSELDFGAPATTRDQVYPDLKSVFSETWSLTWEGTLSLDNITSSIDGPVVRSGQLTVDGHGMVLKDPAQPFCDMGVEPFDIVDLRGCSPANGDGDCPAGYTCYVHPKSVGIGVGACLLKNEAPRLADACLQFLTTLRRYTLDRADSGQLTLLERKHELASTPVDGCIDDNQCDQLAQDLNKIDPSTAATDPFTIGPGGVPQTHWSCQTDPLRAPINPDPARNKRCVQTCSTDPAHPINCASGTICRLLDPSNPAASAGVCMEGVEPPQECVRGPQRYDVRASEAFTVIGSHSGYIHPITRDPSGACTPPPSNPTAGTLQVGRVPINPAKVPACAAPGTADIITGQLNGQPGVFEPNPCSLSSVQQFDTVQSTGMPACASAPPAPSSTPNTRNALGIRFRNQAMTLTLVDPYQSCLPDGQGASALVPFANRGYQLEFTQKAGFSALQVPVIAPTYPVKVVHGPSESLWVIDDGDFLSTSITQASTRGRVFRVEGSNINVANILQ